MKLNFLLTFLAIFIMAGSFITHNTQKTNETSSTVEECNIFNTSGKEFVFRELSPSLQEYGYLTWTKSPDISSEVLSYSAYVGKHARLKDQTFSAAYFEWFVAITENCETIYSVNYDFDEPSGEDQNPVSYLESFMGVYFLETLGKAKTLVGNEVWAKIPNETEASHLLFTSNPEISYPRNNLQKLHVIDIDTYQYAHTFDAAPFSLIVKTETGKEVLLPYSSSDFHETDPNGSY